MLPDQRGECVVITRGKSIGPVPPSKNLLEHERVDVDHAVLLQVQAEHAQLMVFGPVAVELATASEEHEVLALFQCSTTFSPSLISSLRACLPSLVEILA